jgi:hypothetical protein
MQDAAEPLAMTVVVGDKRRRAAGHTDLRRANCAEGDAISMRRDLRRRDRRLHEKHAGDDRREQARAQTDALKDWSHRRLWVPKPMLGFDLLRGQANR